jgi:hypothetical protein
MKTVLSLGLLFAVTLGVAPPVQAQGATLEDYSTPQHLLLYREEVKPGKAPAHTANEWAWASAYARAGIEFGWLGMTSLTGPNEAWFLSGLASMEEWQKRMATEEGNAALSAEVDRLSAQDGELLSRSSGVTLSFRQGLSYQPKVNLAQMRYVRVDIVRVKPGRGAEFADAWREIIAGHEKAKMDEHWAVYAVESGMPDGTFMFFYPFKSLADDDKAGPMHEADAYQKAMGEGGRRRTRERQLESVEWSQSLYFRISPKMSYAPKPFVDAEPAFWNPKPPAAAAKKPGEKK